MASDDPICGVCNEPKSAHVPTARGPLTHPREARGEGHYEIDRPAGIAGSIYPGDDERHYGPTYRFVPAPKPPYIPRMAAHLAPRRPSDGQ